jgi:hypothetical protein
MGRNGMSAPSLRARRETQAAGAERCPRRIVVVDGDEESEVRQVVAEYPASAIKGSRLHAELRRLAAESPGILVAAEWLGPLGWMRFLWCRRESGE